MPATTPTYALPYQLPGDPPDGDDLGKNLAERIETVLSQRFAPLGDQMTAAGAASTTTALTTAMSVTLPAAGTYSFDLFVIGQQTGSAGRPGFALGGTSTPTAWRWASGSTVYNSATGGQGFAGSGTSYPAAGTALTNSDWVAQSGYNFVQVRGRVTVSAAGTLTFRFSQTSGSGSWTPREGSVVDVVRLA